ncbi:MAG: hypothetical protein ACI39C_07285 [Dietzia sp.]
MTAADRLDEIQARADKARRGPWYADGCDVRVSGPGVEDVAYDMDDVDAEFIAHARSDVPALVAALQDALDQCRRIQSRSASTDFRKGARAAAQIIEGYIKDALGEVAP